MPSQVNLAQLSYVVHGQTQRTVLSDTKRQYLGKVKMMTNILNSDPELRFKSLETVETVNGRIAQKHTGEAREIFKMKLPPNPETAQLLFAAISIDDTLPKKRKRDLQENILDDREGNINDEDAGDDGDGDGNGDGDQGAQGHHGAQGAPNAAAEEQQEEVDPRNPAKFKRTVTAQTYQNYKSALKFWVEHDDPDMSKVGHPWPADVDRVLQQAIATYKRDIGIKKRNGIMSQKEGKSKYNLHGFQVICKHFASLTPHAGRGNKGHTVTWEEGLFAGLFTKLSVSTIGRSDNIDDVLLTNMDWENDALTLSFSTTKSDQTGERTADKKRIFANRFKPEICSILALAVYTWCKRRTSDNNEKLFDGYDQNKRYYTELMNAMKAIPANIDIGCNRSDIGTHSNRKFAESTSVSRIDGPNRTQVCLRAGQSVGRTQDCYMSQEDDGDAFVGRTVAQLQFDADEFDSLPCHFAPSTLITLDEYGWDNILDGYSHYPQSYQRVIRFLLPSLVHHYFNDDLKNLYPSNHPLFSQRIFTDQRLIQSLKDKVILKHGSCRESGMWAEGVPTVIMVSREIRECRAKLDNYVSQVDGRFDDISRTINERLDSLPVEIVDTIKSQLVIEGAVPVTSFDIERIVTDKLSAIFEAPGGKMDQITTALERISQQQSNGGGGSEHQLPSNSYHHGGSSLGTYTGEIHHWTGVDDRIHMVPLGFKWPSYNAATMWNLWFLGDANNRICPFRSIPPKVDLITSKCRTNRSRTSKVVSRMVAIAIAGSKILSAREITAANIGTVYEYSYAKLLEELYNARNYPTRPQDININTLANRMTSPESP